MSARSAMARPSGSAPCSVPMTPVRAMPRSTAIPKDESRRACFGRAALLESGLGMGVQIVPPSRHLRMQIRNAVDRRHR